MNPFKPARLALSVALVAACFAAARAEIAREPEPTTAPAAGKVDPKAKAILDHYVEVTGGKEAYSKIKSRLAKAKLEIVGQNLSGTMTSKMMAPDKVLIVTDLGALGVTEQGYNGEVGWSKNAMEGPKILEGKMLDQIKSQAASELSGGEPEKLYTTMTYAGEETIDGVATDKVEVDGKGGKSTQFYAKDTGLLVQSISTQESPQGAMTVTAKLSDYTESGGLKFPKKTVLNLGAISINVVIDEVQVNPEGVTADAFKTPDDIKALVPAEKPAEKK